MQLSGACDCETRDPKLLTHPPRVWKVLTSTSTGDPNPSEVLYLAWDLD